MFQKKFFKKTVPVLLLIALMNGVSVKAQLAGIYNVPSVTYPTINSIVTALNGAGISAPVTINVAAGHVETAPVGGIHMTATGTAANPIIFQKSGAGANPRIDSYAGGTGTPGSNIQDGMWRLIGSDYITINGIDLNDVNTSNPATMEYGFALYRAGISNGCQNNTIVNCMITLNRINNATGTLPSADGSRGIHMANALYNGATSGMTATSPLGTNSFNKFYSNTIQNCNIGIALLGYNAPPPYTLGDTNNEVGGSLATSNTIINYGGATGAANSAMGIKTSAQWNLNISYNLINSNNGSGINHPNALYGIHLGNANDASTTVESNTLTLHGGGTTQGLYAIENNSGAFGTTNMVSISNNLITNCSYQTVTSAFYFCISNLASCFNLNINNNTFTGNSSNNNNFSTCLIRNTAAVSNSVNINNNNLSFNFNAPVHNGGFGGIVFQDFATTSKVRINNNNFSNINFNGTGTGDMTFIMTSGNATDLYIDGNTWNNLNLNNSGTHQLIYDVLNKQSNLSVCNNSIVTGYTRSSVGGGAIWCYLSQAGTPSSCSQTISANNFSNIQSPGATSNSFIGIMNTDGVSSPYPHKIISNNVISNITFGGNGGASTYGIAANRTGHGSTTTGSKIFGNLVSNITATNNVVAFDVEGLGSPTYYADVYSNTILNINSVNSLPYGAVIVGSGIGLNFFKNKISDITSSNGSVVYGLYVSNFSGGTINVYNNAIGNVFSPTALGDNMVSGIYVNSGSTINIINNSVYLNSNSSQAHFGSSAIFANTTANLNLRNNIFINLSTPKGSGRTVAYRRSNSTIATYSATSNNNIFYAGTPSANRLIAFDNATSWSTLAAWQAAVAPRDAVSITEDTPFITTNGTNANFLNIDPTQPTFAESNAAPLALITDDYISSPRNPLTPDIGAWEDNFLLNTLPVELADFRAICTRTDEVSIYWNALTETKAECILEKSANGTEWEELANVRDSGKNLNENEYFFNDKNPFPEISYYRLKQKYANDNIQYSKIISAKNCNDTKKEMYVQPNPAKDKLFIGGINELTKIEIFNSLGLKVSEYLLLHEGAINTNELPDGSYLIRISDNKSVVTKKIIIENSN